MEIPTVRQAEFLRECGLRWIPQRKNDCTHAIVFIKRGHGEEGTEDSRREQLCGFEKKFLEARVIIRAPSPYRGQLGEVVGWRVRSAAERERIAGAGRTRPGPIVARIHLDSCKTVDVPVGHLRRLIRPGQKRLFQYQEL